MTYDTDALVARVQQAVTARRLSKTAAENLLRWLERPAYAAYRPRLMELIAADDFTALENAFWTVIPFGTGGRRGPMGELGTATINERTIAESAHGMAVYLKQFTGQSGGRAVVAHDTRNRSREFAELTASTLAAHGLTVFCFPSHRSTPELSFAVRFLKADVGAMISASHNPPADNGFKAYWSTGAQVLPPHDEGIIRAVLDAEEIPKIDFQRAVAEGRIEIVDEQVDRPYRDVVKTLSLSRNRNIRAIFSPLHGVGETSIYEVLREVGFEQVSLFGPHREPNGNFPNVSGQLPNPERPEVFESMIAGAAPNDQVLLASDPDADRLGLMVRDSSGKFQYVTGNRTGALITDYILRKRQAAGTLSPQHYVVETLVTTPLMAAIAKSHGVRAIDDLLVGFKYIAQTMDAEGPDKFLFAAEESLGFLAGQYCRDKDAAVGALYILESAAELQTEGKTLLDRLDELYVRHGYHIEGQVSITREGPAGKEQIDHLMRQLRDAPPSQLAGKKLVAARDYERHEVRRLPDNARVAPLPDPNADLLFLDIEAEDGKYQIAVRPSGTEPKIKFYLFAQIPVASAAALNETKTRTDSELRALQDAIKSWAQETLAAN